MSSDRCFFAFLPVIHALLINVIMPGGGFIALLLIIDIAIISSYGVHCKGSAVTEVFKMCKVFGAGYSYIGGVVAYYTGMMFWEEGVPLRRGMFLFITYLGILCWLRFPYQYYSTIKRLSGR